MQEELKKSLLAAISLALENLAKAGTFPPEAAAVTIVLQIPKERKFGDYASNIAMVLAKITRKPPRENAQVIIAELERMQLAIIEQLELAGAGFINFYLQKNSFHSVLDKIAQAGLKFGDNDLGQGQRLLIEFVSANPTGPLHVGHGRGAALGDSLARLLAKSGYLVDREFYINDAGRQIDKLASSTWVRYLQHHGREATLPEDAYQGDYITEIAVAITDLKGPALFELPKAEAQQFCGHFALSWLLENIKADLADFGVLFNSWFSEKKLHSAGLITKIVAEFEQRKRIYKKDGALWLESTAVGDTKDRVVINSTGMPTYLAADMAYHQHKYQRGYDVLLDIWGSDHHGYIPRLRAVVAGLGRPESSFNVLLYQFVTLTRDNVEISMSKRTGEFVTLREVIAEVGTDAMRYNFLMRTGDSHLDFDLELAKKQSNENPVYYVQYAHARICSILRKAGAAKVALPSSGDAELALLDLPAERELVKELSLLPEVIAKATTNLQPHLITNYLYRLAACFHRYYNANRIIGQAAKLQQARLYLLIQIRTVLQICLELLGVKAPEKM